MGQGDYKNKIVEVEELLKNKKKYHNSSFKLVGGIIGSIRKKTFGSLIGTYLTPDKTTLIYLTTPDNTKDLEKILVTLETIKNTEQLHSISSGFRPGVQTYYKPNTGLAGQQVTLLSKHDNNGGWNTLRENLIGWQKEKYLVEPKGNAEKRYLLGRYVNEENSNGTFILEQIVLGDIKLDVRERD